MHAGANTASTRNETLLCWLRRLRLARSPLRLHMYGKVRLRREVGVWRKAFYPVARFRRKDFESILSLLVAAEVRSVHSRDDRARFHRILDLGAGKVFAEILPKPVLDLHFA